MRKLAALAAAVVLATLMAVPTLAADNATVSAHITVDAPCLTVNTNTIDFGHAPFSAGTMQTIRKPLSYTNCAAISERVYGRGSNATGPGGVAQWTLVSGGTCGQLAADRFQILALQATLSYVNLTTSDQYLEDVPATGPGIYDNLGVTMPCTGSSGAGVTMDFQVTYTASF